MVIQLILKFKNSFGNYHRVCPKNPLRAFVLRHPVYKKNFDYFMINNYSMRQCLLSINKDFIRQQIDVNTMFSCQCLENKDSSLLSYS